jgi:AraC-like DNA-binding protein
MSQTDIGVDIHTFCSLADVYQQRWGVGLVAADTEGRVVLGSAACDPLAPAQCDAARRLAIAAALRWGESTVETCPGSQLVWAVPLMRNQQLLGGLVAHTSENKLFPTLGGTAAIDTRAACADLRLLAERHNLTNAALLHARREEYLREQLKADALHEFKGAPPHDPIRAMFLRQEPSLLAAVRRSDLRAARQVINNMLVAMLQRAGDNVTIAKTFFLELVVMMCRAAVESGGNPEQLLGANFQSLSKLSHITDDEQLAPWLHETLERVMTCISSSTGRPSTVPLAAALEFMSENLSRHIGRDDIARAAHLSPAHFSRLFRRELGISCSARLAQMRAERAAELLVQSDLPLVQVALQCGFSDQSYFTKVFRKYMGSNPHLYRQLAAERHASGR